MLNSGVALAGPGWQKFPDDDPYGIRAASLLFAHVGCCWTSSCLAGCYLMTMVGPDLGGRATLLLGLC